MNAFGRLTAEFQAPSSADIHIWRAHISRTDTAGDRLERLLGEDERVRAARFRFERDRGAFVFRRALTRVLLARALNVEPQDVRFAAGRWGKLSLAPPFDRTGLTFNLSHSSSLVFVAIARHREIGVDVERVRTDIDVESLARYIFSSEEMATFSNLPASQQPGAFFSGWTRKEAFVKATGVGLSRPLVSVEVTIAPGVPAALLEKPEAPVENAAWSLADVEAGCAYRAAVAAEGHGWQLTCSGDARDD